MTKRWHWISVELAHAVHQDQLARNGGENGVRDDGLLDSALARPKNLLSYGTPSPFDLAAAYASGLIGNHPFVDGNKRTGFLIACVFLDLNGWELDAAEAEAYAATMALTEKGSDEAAFAAWLKKNAKRTPE